MTQIAFVSHLPGYSPSLEEYHTSLCFNCQSHFMFTVCMEPFFFLAPSLSFFGLEHSVLLSKDSAPERLSVCSGVRPPVASVLLVFKTHTQAV